jgi:hypothetical protein
MDYSEWLYAARLHQSAKLGSNESSKRRCEKIRKRVQWVAKRKKQTLGISQQIFINPVEASIDIARISPPTTVRIKLCLNFPDDVWSDDSWRIMEEYEPESKYNDVLNDVFG